MILDIRSYAEGITESSKAVLAASSAASKAFRLMSPGSVSATAFMEAANTP